MKKNETCTAASAVTCEQAHRRKESGEEAPRSPLSHARERRACSWTTSADETKNTRSKLYDLTFNAKTKDVTSHYVLITDEYFPWSNDNMTDSYSVATWALKSRQSLRSLVTLKNGRITNMIMGLQSNKRYFRRAFAQ